MDVERFQNSSAGRILQVGQGEITYWAFVPDPLPPQFQFTARLVYHLSEADRALGELSGLGRSISNPQLLVGPFMHREAVLSSRIEGTRADIEDLYAYQAGQLELPGIKRTVPESDVREVYNYVRALRYGLGRLETLPVSLRLIRELHERLVEGVRGNSGYPGEFRSSQNWIGEPGSTLNTATYVPPPVQQMHEALYAFEEYLHRDNSLPPLTRLALVHYQFEAIHPFIDGNGRIGRLLISLLLLRWELLSAPLLYLSAFFERNRDEYYDLLFRVSADSAWEEWIVFFLRGIAEQARDATRKAKQLQDLQYEWRERLTETRTSALLLSLVDILFEKPILTIPDAQESLDVTYKTAQRNVYKLVDANIVKQMGDNEYGKTFAAEEILRIVDENGS